jgi:signal peptidase II
VPALGNVLAVTHVQNTGIAFGLFKGANALIAALTALVVVFVARYLRALPTERLLLRFALSLLLAGAAGNLIDRLRLGYVTDFIAVGSFARFNVADSAVTVGMLLLAVDVLRGERRASSEIA